MSQVWREFDRKKRVIQAQMLTNIFAQRSIGCKFKQPAMVFRQFQFARRAQHAFAFNAAQLPNFDDERLTVFARWQLGTDHCAGYFDANSGIWCAANNVE